MFTESQRNRLKHYPPLPFKLNPEDRNGEHTPYMKGLGKKLEVKSVAEKLIFGVFDLPNYCIYSEMLKYLLENDMCELVQVHAVVHMKLGFVFRDFIKAINSRIIDLNLTYPTMKMFWELIWTAFILI